MSSTATTAFLHVANGSATTDLLAEAGVAGARSIWADPLYEGPVPGDCSDDELLAVRARFLTAGDPIDAVDPVNDMTEWRAVIARHESYDEVVLWFEHDLFDQLNLIQLLTWIRARVPASKTISLVCIGSFPGRPDFKGLGELTARELASLSETRAVVTAPQYALAERAWRAFREPTPEALDRLRHEDTSALPYLARAIDRFLQEYPWRRDGLSRSERRLLQLASKGSIGLGSVFPRMQDGEDAYYVTDLSLAALAETFSSGPAPLLTLAAAPGDDIRRLRASIGLTDLGRAVLDGRTDRVTACGIDRWFGGVHVHGNSAVWRWDDARQTIACA